ncbi:MAG: hypothetical protein R3B84_24490 [Zavarzinella sp.]
MLKTTLALFAVLWINVVCFAQPSRYELGRRMHDFEVAWDQPGIDAAGKKRAAVLVNDAVQSFFRLNLTKAGQLMDQARHSLRSAEPASPTTQWAESLTFELPSRVFDTETKSIEATLVPFYKTELDIPAKAKAVFLFEQTPLVTAAISKLPQPISIPISLKDDADKQLHLHVVVDGKVLFRRAISISFLVNKAKRLQAADDALLAMPELPALEANTAAHLVRLIKAGDRTPETDMPYARFLSEIETILKTKSPYYTPERGGEFWLKLPIEKRTVTVRVAVPQKAKPPMPVVLALHGAGGSENLFFDGYGNGITIREATRRGWFIVATNAGGLFGTGGAPPIDQIVEVLAKRYPLDTSKIFVVGHSMGAAHTISLAQQTKLKLTAIAALGGGGNVRQPEKFAKLPTFIGCGKDDFLLNGARSLKTSLEKSPTVEYREYDDIEHLLIVREATPDVYRFFEKQLQK